MWRQLEHLAACAAYGPTAGIDVLRLDLPGAGHSLLDQHRALDDKGKVVPTRTAAPDQAPQSLDLRVLESVLVAGLVLARIGKCRALAPLTTREALAPLTTREALAPLTTREALAPLAYASAAFAEATSLPNASMSLTAMSARILRSTSISAAFRPAMNRL